MLRRGALGRIVLIGAFVLGVCAPAAAGILTVDDDGPADFPSIQSAIIAASNGDEIVVYPGQYRETVRFLGKSVTLRSSSGPAVTVIYLEGETRIIELDSGGAVRGFTIRGGGNVRVGAGILVTAGAQPTIEGNIIENHTAIWNDATGFPAFGAGVAVELNSNATITRNIIRNNVALGAPDDTLAFGGAVDVDGGCSATITGNLIINNQATDTGGAISLDAEAGAVTPVVITNNTIVANRAGRDAPNLVSYGGGISVDAGARVVIRNNAITGNSAAFSGGGIHFFSGNLSGITYENNDFNGNLPDDCAGLTPISKCSNGQFFFAPLYLDPAAGVHRLRSDSELIDLGTSTGAPATDLEGRPRSVDGDMNGAAAPDIGAYENQAETTRLRFDDKVTLRWDGSKNLSVVHEAYRGQLSLLAPGALGLCWRPALTATTTTDTQDPPDADGFYYLVRGRDLAVGSLGFDSAGGERSTGDSCP